MVTAASSTTPDAGGPDAAGSGAAGAPVPGSDPGAEPVHAPAPGGLAKGLVRSLRPRQWLKNSLVASAPFFAGQLLDLAVLVDLGIAFAAFCLASSGIYFVNDVRDVEFDRRHPTKRNRPIASGAVPIGVGIAVGVSLLVGGLALAWFASTPQFAGAIATYIAISLAYCFFLKDQPVIDLAVIASGFLLRAMSGGLATDIPMSDWFLIVASFGALFIAAGKRYSELVAVGEEAVTRRSLAAYSASYLRFLWGAAAAVTMTSYTLWAFEIQRRDDNPWAVISAAPFVLGLLRYAVDVDSARAGTPEAIAFGDRVLQGLGVIWLALITVGVVLA